MPETDKIENLLTRNVEKVIERDHLKRALKSGKTLRVKLGIDPTGDKIHIGRAVALWKLKGFQDLGHKIVLIIGDFTAQIGDPSDKLEKRPFLAKAQIDKNLKSYLPQIGKILNIKKTEVRRNSEWLDNLDLMEVARLTDIFTFAQIMKRRNFRDRLKRDDDITLRELMYPMMQGYDSVAVKADVEIGGSDQLFNLLAGRKIQEHYGQNPQDIMTTKMLLGLDGRKMSTSWGNVVNVADSPDEQFGKIMSMRDDQIPGYFELATDEPDLGAKYKRLISEGGAGLKRAKWHLAFDVVMRYGGEAAAQKASEKWEELFSKKEMPADLPLLKISKKGVSASDVVIASGIAKSRSEARRLITQGGFSMNGAVKNDPNEILSLSGGEAVKIGKKNFFRIKI